MFLSIIKRKAFSLLALFLDKNLLCQAATLQYSNGLALLTTFYVFYVLPQKDFLKWQCSLKLGGNVNFWTLIGLLIVWIESG